MYMYRVDSVFALNERTTLLGLNDVCVAEHFLLRLVIADSIEAAMLAVGDADDSAGPTPQVISVCFSK